MKRLAFWSGEDKGGNEGRGGGEVAQTSSPVRKKEKKKKDRRDWPGPKFLISAGKTYVKENSAGKRVYRTKKRKLKPS